MEIESVVAAFFPFFLFFLFPCRFEFCLFLCIKPVCLLYSGHGFFSQG